MNEITGRNITPNVEEAVRYYFDLFLNGNKVTISGTSKKFGVSKQNLSMWIARIKHFEAEHELYK